MQTISFLVNSHVMVAFSRASLPGTHHGRVDFLSIVNGNSFSCCTGTSMFCSVFHGQVVRGKGCTSSSLCHLSAHKSTDFYMTLNKNTHDTRESAADLLSYQTTVLQTYQSNYTLLERGKEMTGDQLLTHPVLHPIQSRENGPQHH